MKTGKLVRMFVALMMVAAMSVATVNAQSVFSQGDKVLNLGFGIGNYLGGTDYKTTIPPISASFEYCVKDNLFNEKSSLGIGGLIAYSANKWETSYTDWDGSKKTVGFKYTYFILGARGVFHYQFIDRLDTYGGLMLGYNVSSSKYIGTSTNNHRTDSMGGVILSGFVGARYYFNDKVAAFAELGFGIAVLNLGVSLKF